MPTNLPQEVQGVLLGSAPGTAAYNPAWYAAAAIFIDPLNVSGFASDSNDGLTALTPLLTIAESARRHGSWSPALSVATVITWLSSGPASDPCLYTPTYYLAGSLTLAGQVTVTTTTTIAVFTAAVRGGANTRAQLTTALGVVAWVAGTLLRTTTAPRASSFWVEADGGGGIAVISNPLSTPIGFASATVAPANGDTLQICAVPTIFAPNVNGVTLAQINVNASTLIEMNFGPSGLGVVALETKFSALMQVPTGNNRQHQLIGCYTSSFSGSARFMGGTVVGTPALSDGTALDGDVHMLGAPQGFLAGVVTLGSVYLAAGWANQNNALLFANAPSTFGPGGRPLVWGPATFDAANGSRMRISSGTAVQVMVNTGGLTLDGAATGSTFTPATGAWSVGPIALTPAAVDANKCLMNPNAGSRINV